MPSPDLGLADKDTTTSCIFAFPDRPVESLPPNYPPGIPPPLYPYDPVDDWPLIPLPIPGSNPHPSPPPDPNFPLVNGSLIFYQTVLWLSSIGAGLRNTFGDPPWTTNLGINADIFASIDGSKEFAPLTICAPILLSEAGFDYTSGEGWESGLFIYATTVGLGPECVVYVCYYLRFIQGVTDVSVFAPCPLGGPGQLPSCRVTTSALFSIGPSNFGGPGTTTIEKTFQTGAIKITDNSVTVPLGFITVG